MCTVTQAGGASSGPISHGAQVATWPKRCSRFGEFSLRVSGAQVLFWARVFIWYHKLCLYRVYGRFRVKIPDITWTLIMCYC